MKNNRRSTKLSPRQIKKLIIIAVLAAAVITGLLLFLRKRVSDQFAGSSGTEVSSAAVTAGSISTSVYGSGRLSDDDVEQLDIPSGVELEKIYVSLGDRISEGDILASVKMSSVLSAMSDISDELDSLDEQISSAAGSSSDSYISSSVSGRVKKVYAEPGDSVASVMYEHGALALISLDGYMAVDIENGTLSAGDSVTVTASDGKSYSGTVSAAGDGTATVLVTDNGTVYGDSVTAEDENGNTLGSGTLYIHDELKAVGYTGNVSYVYVSGNSYVYSGSVYSISEGTAAVTVPDTAAEYGDTVTVSYDGDVIGTGILRINNPLRVVGYAGTVSSVSVSAGAYVYSGQQLLTLTDTGYSARYETLLEKRRTLETQMQELFKAYETGGVYAASSGCVSGLNEDIVTESNTVHASAAAYFGGSGGIKLLSSVSHIGRRAVLLSSESPDTGIQDSETPSPAPSGEPSPSPSPSPEPGESTEYIGKVTDIKENEDGTRTVTVALTDGSRIELDSAQLGEKAAGIKTGDILALEYSPSGELINVTVYQNGSGGNTPGGQDGMPGGSGGMSGGMGGGSGAAMNGAQEAESDPDYIMEETELCTLTPYDTAEISLTVDELDISRLSIGQPVTVTLDALPGQSFDGSITLIDPNGSSAGGDTKYTVTVSIARTQDMLEGMNASVTAELACHDGLLLIPAAALYEDAGGTYVYTGTDKNGEPSGPVAVTTGLSDGTNVEITGGLSDGDSFCYLYSSALEYTFT